MKTLWSLLLGAMSYTVLLTSSRAGLLTLLLGVGISLWEFGVKGGQKALFFLAALGTIALLFAGLTTKMGERLSSISVLTGMRPLICQRGNGRKYSGVACM